MLPSFLMTCIAGEQMMNLMRPPQQHSPEEIQRELEARLDLFYHSVLIY
jgi:hypothetical protein